MPTCKTFILDYKPRERKMHSHFRRHGTDDDVGRSRWDRCISESNKSIDDVNETGKSNVGEKRHRGWEAKKNLQFSSVSVCGGVVDFCQSKLWETLTDLWHHSTCCSKAHIKTEERVEGTVKKKTRRSWLETELRVPPSLILHGVTQELRNAAELLTPEQSHHEARRVKHIHRIATRARAITKWAAIQSWGHWVHVHFLVYAYLCNAACVECVRYNSRKDGCLDN